MKNKTKIIELENLKEKIEKAKLDYIEAKFDLKKDQKNCNHELITLLDIRSTSKEENRSHFLECNACLICGLVENEESKLVENTGVLVKSESSVVIDASRLEGYDVFKTQRDLNKKLSLVSKITEQTLFDNPNISFEETKEIVEQKLLNKKIKVK